MLWVAGVCLCVSATSVFAQNASTDNAGPNRILQMLDEKERSYIEGKVDASELSAEEIEHVKRIQRLHQLETAKDVETEPAGAQLAQQQFVQRQPVSEIEDLEMQQQESTTVMMRDMARLRAEVLRLNARVQVLEMELDGTAESLEPEPRFYLPVR